MTVLTAILIIEAISIAVLLLMLEYAPPEPYEGAWG